MSEAVVQLNKRLFRGFQVRGIRVGAVPDMKTRLISDHLLAEGLADATLVNTVLEEATGVQALDPTFVAFDDAFVNSITRLVPAAVAREEHVFPVRHEGNHVHVVMALPADEHCLRRLEALTGSRIQPYCCHTAAIDEAIAANYDSAPDTPEPLAEDFANLADLAVKSINRLRMTGADIPALAADVDLIRLLQFILNRLVGSGASDLHFEPQEGALRVRFRKDGVMQTAWELPGELRAGVLPRLKMISGMDLQEAHLPQDGSIDYGLIQDRDVDIRVSALPSLYGEKIVMRVLDRGRKQLTLNDLGMEDQEADLLQAVINQPTGLILATGPTGSGKSTTLYAVLTELNTDTVNIVTAEDPVEYRLAGITQVNCTADSGLTFNEALRSFLRQDPDIIMVGEIRDAGTADMALKAAMTGHLVLSTLHTNDAASAISRLVNMGIPAYLVASARICVIAQRLMRKLCSGCREAVDVPPESLAVLGLSPSDGVFYHGAGCDRCSGTGYHGRVGIYEVLRVDDRIIELILDKKPAGAIMAAAVDAGMTTLREAALHKLRAGLTSVSEVLRVTVDS